MDFEYTKGSQHVIVALSDNPGQTESDSFYARMETVEAEDANIIADLSGLTDLSDEGAATLLEWRNDTLDNLKSFVICGYKSELPTSLEEVEFTPTLSEAQDIVFMDEVERSLSE